MVYSIYYQTVWYTPQEERSSVKPSAFLLQSPNYKLYTQIGAHQELPDGVIPESLDELLLKNCVLDSMNVSNMNSPLDLPVEIQQDLLKAIIDLFYVDDTFESRLNFSLDAMMDTRFSNETWSCAKCQEKRLDRQRNCPYLDPLEYHDDSYSITVGEEVYTVCPMDKKDNKLIGVAFEAYKIAEASFLPTVGGYGEQPYLFCVLSQRVKEKVKYYENKALEEVR